MLGACAKARHAGRSFDLGGVSDRGRTVEIEGETLLLQCACQMEFVQSGKLHRRRIRIDSQTDLPAPLPMPLQNGLPHGIPIQLRDRWC